MTPLADVMHATVIMLKERGLLPAGVSWAAAVAVALETFQENPSLVPEALDVANQVDAIAVRDFGAATRAARVQVIDRLLTQHVRKRVKSRRKS